MTLRSIQKALAPLVLAITAFITQWIVTGELDEEELGTIIGGIVTALVVFRVPNHPPAYPPTTIDRPPLP